MSTVAAWRQRTRPGFFNPHTIEHKRLPSISKDRVAKAFDRGDLQVFTDSADWLDQLRNRDLRGTVLLFMSSGTFDGISLEELARELTENRYFRLPKPMTRICCLLLVLLFQSISLGRPAQPGCFGTYHQRPVSEKKWETFGSPILS